VKKSIVWTAAAVAAVGFGVPAFAAISSPGEIRQIAPTPVVSVDPPDITESSVDDSTTSVSLVTSSSPPISVEDVSGNCDEAEHANDAACTGVNAAGAPESSTANSVEDVSGNCDEAEHANDPSCAGSGAPSNDNSGRGSSNSGSDNSGSDNSGRGSNSGHGNDDSGSDDSGHGGGDG